LVQTQTGFYAYEFRLEASNRVWVTVSDRPTLSNTIAICIPGSFVAEKHGDRWRLDPEMRRFPY